MRISNNPLGDKILEHVNSKEEVSLAFLYSVLNASDKNQQANVRSILNYLVNTKKIARARRGIYVAIEGVSDEDSS